MYNSVRSGVGKTNYSVSAVGYVTDNMQKNQVERYNMMLWYSSRSWGGNIEPLVAPAFMS